MPQTESEKDLTTFRSDTDSRTIATSHKEISIHNANTPALMEQGPPQNSLTNYRLTNEGVPNTITTIWSGENSQVDIWDMGPQKPKIAVKVIALDKGLFQAEVNMVTKLKHKNITKCIRHYERDGKGYIHFEYVEGRNLQQYVKQKEDLHLTTLPLDIQEELARIAGDIAEGMKYLESKKIVHRDLSPRNILIGKDLSVKVVDFALARESDHQQNQTGLPCDCSAPEIYKTGRATTKSDVWSFGVILWTLYSFNKASSCKTIEEVRSLVKFIKVSIPLYTPKKISKLIKWCLEENPQDRPTFEKIATILSKLLLNGKQEV